MIIYRGLVLFGGVCREVRWGGPCAEHVSFNHVSRPQVPGPERCCAERRWRSHCGRLETQYAIILKKTSKVHRQYSLHAGM